MTAARSLGARYSHSKLDPAALVAHPVSTRADTLGSVTECDDLGTPGWFLTLAAWTPVYSSDGPEVGRVKALLAEPAIDIFDGIVLDRSRLPGGHRFVDAAHVGEIHERGVVPTILASVADQLPEPGANPVDRDPDEGDQPQSELEDRLRRAWDLISGRE